MSPRSFAKSVLAGLAATSVMLSGIAATAQDRLPWERSQPPGQQRLGADEDSYRPDPPPAPYQGGGYSQPRGSDVYAPAPQGGYGGAGGNQGYDSRSYRAQGAAANDAYRPSQPSGGGYGTASGDVYRPPSSQGGYGEPYTPPPSPREPYDRDYGDNGPRRYEDDAPRGESRGERRTVGGYYSQNEIYQAGHGFFGSVSRGLASVIEYTFQKAGRPNGYILGEDAGGAFVAGLRYGEGRLHTKDAGTHKVYWQGPSLGYDFGGEGSKTMVLVYNLRDPSDIYHRFGGVQGSAYLVGGVSVQFQKYGDVVLAPIRSGVGLRLGANIGYLKYTRSPTWNPF